MNQILKQRKTLPNELLDKILGEYISLKKQTAALIAELYILADKLSTLQLNNWNLNKRFGIDQLLGNF
uniref:Transposase n=1 Tax=Meloidogyne hapla TaxID=6305 RepID=A0A1I8BWU1_MELHA